MSNARSAHGVLTLIFAVLLIPQFFLVGLMLFEAEGFGAHNGLGSALAALSLVILILALVSRHLVTLSAVLLGLMVLQIVLAAIGREGSGWIGALHAVNALVVVGVAGSLAHRVGPVLRGRRPATT